MQVAPVDIDLITDFTMTAAAAQPFSIRLGKAIRPFVNDIIAKQSTVSNEPLLDPSAFPWIAPLLADWRTIRDEALAVTRKAEAVPPLGLVSPDLPGSRGAVNGGPFFLHGYGYRIEANRARCPATAALIDRVPELNSAFFSVLAPGAVIPRHRGVTKGLLTCHIGLQVPDGDCRMTLDDRLEFGWQEGRALVFDDSYPHAVANATGGTRIILLIQFCRPARTVGRLVTRAFLSGVRRTRFVAGTVANLAAWERDHAHDFEKIED